jgi:DNA invertase Pin-like site-specific DNA recombinase
MNQVLCSPKIKPEHLARKALVYLRQSSDKQVRQNKESQRLQYDVAERMRNLGWKEVEIISSDLGCSAGIASPRREGFERVLSAVALGEVGIVGSWECAGINRHVVGDERALQERRTANPSWPRLLQGTSRGGT